jgi:hypothetical protein
MTPFTVPYTEDTDKGSGIITNEITIQINDSDISMQTNPLHNFASGSLGIIVDEMKDSGSDSIEVNDRKGSISLNVEERGMTVNQIMKHREKEREIKGESVYSDSAQSSNYFYSEKQEGANTESNKSTYTPPKSTNRTRQMNFPQSDVGNELAEKALTVGREGWAQTKIAGIGALRGVLEVERAFEMLTLGAYYKYSSTAFVTFRTRMAETIAHQMLLTDDMMEISHAPNPHDVIWENVAIPKSQVCSVISLASNICMVIFFTYALLAGLHFTCRE